MSGDMYTPEVRAAFPSPGVREVPKAQPKAQRHALTADEQATLLDIVRQYHEGTATPHNAMAWVYGLVANSELNHNGSLD